MYTNAIAILQVESGDNIWLELKTNFNTKLFVIDPDDEIFMPIFVWPSNPEETELRTSSSWDEVKVTKRVNIKKDDSCISTTEYIYGGSNLFCKISKLLL